MGVTNQQLATRCAIVGGGPCGLMLGYLLARAGVDVVVLEKHADFFRDFRGDTIHPSTLELMNELGLYDEFLKLPHQRAETISAFFGAREYAFADFRHLPTRAKFIALMPQWDFLNFIASQGRSYLSFHLAMQAEATELIEEGGRITGVRAKTPQGQLDVRADLTVGCDGRHSIVRERAGFTAQDLGAPMDVLWFRLSKKASDPGETMGRFTAGRIVILIDRGDYWQCAFLIRKGAIEETKRAGLPAFRASVAHIMPVFADRVDELKDWDQVKLLTVAVNRLERWHRQGLLCIGDAAHAMSPIGGVGVNLAVQDAVAAANILWRPLRDRTVREDDLDYVQERREFPTRVTQRMQVFLQKKVIEVALGADQALQAPLPLRVLSRFAPLRRIPARLVGMGVRPEHIHTPDVRGAAAGAGANPNPRSLPA
jgi:2-polyprenyl-6-methoxyphenol hydroxylase-like FAD-dependent oxidoreductase